VSLIANNGQICSDPSAKFFVLLLAGGGLSVDYCLHFISFWQIIS